MKPAQLIFTVIFLALFTATMTSAIGLNSDEVPISSVIEFSGRGFSFEVDFSEMEMTSVEIEGSTFSQIEISGCGATSSPGLPELPAFTKLIRLPSTGGYSVSAQFSDPVIYSGLDVFPSQPLQRDNEETPPFTLDEGFYRADSAYPSEMVESGEIAVWRDIRVAPVNIYPVQYNPQRRELVYYRRVVLRVEYTESGENELRRTHTSISEAFAPLYRAMTIGAGGGELDLPVQRGAYLIITPTQYNNADLQELADWKKRMGYYTYIAPTTETGSSASQIKQYIANAYNTWEVPPEYVLLVGDYDVGMPTHYVTGAAYECCTDLPYVLIDGSDYFPELSVGRLSIDNTSQLQVFLNKMNNYEKTPYMTNTDWYQQALVIADYSGAESVRYTKEFTRDMLLRGGYNNVIEAFYPGAPVSRVSQSINGGVSLVNYRGYGGHTYWTLDYWQQYNNGDVSSLSNGFRMPVVTSMVCGGGNFAYSSDPCFGEQWLRVGTSSTPKGAIAFCGPSELHTHTKWNNNLDCGLYWGIFQEGLQHFGPALTFAKMELWLDYPHNRVGVGTGTNSVGFYFHVYNILGDPGLRMWTGIPRSLTAVYEDTVLLGVNQFPVSLTLSGQPVPGAYVCILKEGEIFEGGFTDEAGSINLPMENYSAGTMKLTVTGKNIRPILCDIPVVSAPIQLGISSYVVDDDNMGGTSGNNDGMISPAETFDLQTWVKNFGTSVTATGVSGTLSAESPKLNIINGSANLTDLAPGDSVEAVFRLSAAANLNSADNLGLRLNLTSSQGNFTPAVWVNISDAEFMVNYDFWPTILEPGEQRAFRVTLTNVGLCNASNVVGRLSSLDPMVLILSGVSNFGNIAAGGSANNYNQLFFVSADPSMVPGRLTHLRIDYTTGEGYRSTSHILTEAGTAHATDPMGPDDYGYYCFDSGDTGYIKAPVYSYSSINSYGTQLDLPDTGDERDCRVTVALPFTFTYYGQQYDTISVCSNGFIAMGISHNVTFRNKAIPSAMGPPAMIAGFWDDLQMRSGGRVYKYFDSGNHRFIIEYYNVKNDYQNANERFQIILRDPAYYPTPTGDGEILLQYDDVNDVDSNDNYCTVGIEDRYHTTGLQYVFSNIYPGSSMHLRDNIAILFTTDPGFTQGYTLDFDFEPVSPPVLIPAGGGSFQYRAGGENTGSSAAVFDFWTEVQLPNGVTLINPIMLRRNLTLQAGASAYRVISQYVPANAPPGRYIYRGIVGNYNSRVRAYVQEFPLVKAASDAGRASHSPLGEDKYVSDIIDEE